MRDLDRHFADITRELSHIGPMAKTLSLLTRPALVARPGRTLIWSDWSAIEARVLPWLAASRGAEKVLDIFRECDHDPSLPDIYKRTAGPLLGKDPIDVTDDERQSHGKVPVLSLGFGGALGALQAMAVNYGVHLDDELGRQIVTGWRLNNPWARAFWDKLWEAFNGALDNPNTIYPAGRVAYVFDPTYLGGTVFCALPCGRLLSYPHVRRRKEERKNRFSGKVEEVTTISYLKGYGRAYAWYGKLCLAGDTKVATSRGWIALRDVALGDRLWDGEAWVSHDGLIFQGVKPTVPVDGVRMTPDHLVMTEGGWREAQHCNGLHRESVRLPDGFGARSDSAARKAGAVALPLRLRRGAYRAVRWLDAAKSAAVAAIVWLRHGASYQCEPDDARYEPAPGIRCLAVHAGSLPASDASSLGELRRAWHSGMRALGYIRGVLAGHGADLLQRPDARAQGQRRWIQPGELQVGDARRASAQPAAQPAGGHSGAVLRVGYSEQHAALPVGAEAVYDIVNAGPRARFVVLGADGPLIVHNCENVTQGFAASLLRHVLVEITEDPELYDLMPPVGDTHDEVITEPLIERAEEAKVALTRVMTKKRDIADGLPLHAEAGGNWWYSKSKPAKAIVR